ncbi:MAG TPA: hypothetical protein GX745_08700, partial [Clostridiales bacterium]|nr:hypothetical protein [Clostridiales bacterium]
DVSKGVTKKKFINRSLLTISIGVSAYIFARMTDIPLVQGLFFVLIAFYEIVMQDVLGVGLIFIKQGKWRVLPGILCILFYIAGYVGIYAVPTAMGVFLLFIDQQSVRAEITQAEYDIQKRILDLDLESFETYNLQMKTEAQTGYGRRSEKITEEQNKLRESLAVSLEKFKEISKERTKVSIDVFESLSETIKPIKEVSPTTIKLVMFLVIFFGMYLGLIVTHEEFGFSVSSDSNIENSKVPEKLRNKACQSSSKSSDEKFQSSPESFDGKLQSSPGSFEKPQSEWERFVRASIRESGNLNSAKRVNMLTGIPIDRCLEYRKRLEAMTIGGEPVVETTQGVSRAKFEKEVILERVREAI